MAKKKKSSKYSSAKKAAAKSKETKSDMSTAASASSLDDTLDTSDDAARPGAEPRALRAAAVNTPSIFTNEVEGFMTNSFPEITSATLKNYVRNEEQENTYREFREVVRGLSRQGEPLAGLAVTLCFLSSVYLLGIGPEKGGAAGIKDLANIPLLMKPQLAPYVDSFNGILQLDPSYAMYNDIEGWMGFVSAAFFTIVIFRIVIACKRTAKDHISDSTCHFECVYGAVSIIILAAAICLTAVWMHKLMQLFNYISPRPCVTIQTFISLQYTCQSAFEYSAIALFAFHRLRIFYHRYYSAVHYSSKLGVGIWKWSLLNILVWSGETTLVTTLLYVTKCHLLIITLFTFLDEIIDFLQMYFKF